MPEQRVLTLRELNRATLARQSLLVRRRLGPVAAIERLAGLQAQWPPSPYVALWSRLDGFRRGALERAVLRGDVVKPAVMRGTLHLVSARDYPVFYAAFRETAFWGTRIHHEHARAAVAGMRQLADGRRVTFDEGVAYLQREHGHDGIEARRIMYALRRQAHLLHARETALRTTTPAAVYEAHPEPEEVDVVAARTELARRYLGAFGPATRADLADWSGLRVGDFAAALEALEPLRRFRDEQGRELLDAPRAPLPPADAPAPVRFLPKWDSLLLGHANRRRVISDELRKVVIGRNGDVAQTVLVDGTVAATWSSGRDGKVTVAPFAPLPQVWRRAVDEEAARLEAWLRD